MGPESSVLSGMYTGKRVTSGVLTFVDNSRVRQPETLIKYRIPILCTIPLMRQNLGHKKNRVIPELGLDSLPPWNNRFWVMTGSDIHNWYDS